MLLACLNVCCQRNSNSSAIWLTDGTDSQPLKYPCKWTLPLPASGPLLKHATFATTHLLHRTNWHIRKVPRLAAASHKLHLSWSHCQLTGNKMSNRIFTSTSHVNLNVFIVFSLCFSLFFFSLNYIVNHKRNTNHIKVFDFGVNRHSMFRFYCSYRHIAHAYKLAISYSIRVICMKFI